MNETPSFNRVYMSILPSLCGGKMLYPESRNSEVLNAKNLSIKLQKYWSWKLLEHAINHTLHKKIEDYNFSKNKYGKWSTDSFDFSITHTDNFVAVAISNAKIGIDIEKISAPISKKFPSRVFNEFEFEEYISLTDDKKNNYLIMKWTQKEAIFKSSDSHYFVPKSINTYTHTVQSEFYFYNNEKYVMSVASEIPYQLISCNINNLNT